MKFSGIIILAITMFASIACGNQGEYKTETFTVYGNCGMCKKTIEKSLDGVNGVSEVDWNMSNDKMTVSFDPKVISLADVHKKIAAVGYDTDKERAPDKVYDKLHSCCKYDRPE